MKPSKSVSFRFLRAVTNQVTGDTTTVAVVQWDGATLMFDQDADVLRHHPAKGDVQKVLKELRRAVRAAPPSQARTQQGIDAAFPVDLTTGGLLRWSSEHTGLTPNPATHFEGLVTLAGLHGGEQTTRRVGAKQVQKELRALGKRLAEVHPKRILVETELQARYRFVPALSWQNGRWNHAVAWSFDVEERGEAESRLKHLIGTLETGIPEDDAAVVAYAPPRDADVATFVSNELKYVESMGTYRRSLRLARRDTCVDASSLEKLVTDDIAS